MTRASRRHRQSSIGHDQHSQTYIGSPPQYLFFCFHYVVSRGESGVITHSYPTFFGQLNRNRLPDCPQTDGGDSDTNADTDTGRRCPVTTGGLNRPPPPPVNTPPTP